MSIGPNFLGSVTLSAEGAREAGIGGANLDAGGASIGVGDESVDVERDGSLSRAEPPILAVSESSVLNNDVCAVELINVKWLIKRKAEAKCRPCALFTIAPPLSRLKAKPSSVKQSVEQRCGEYESD